MQKWYYWIVVIIFGGCQSHWHYSEILTYSYDQVWQACLDSMSLHGYSSDKEDKKQGVILSAWQNFLYPFRPGGYRRRVTMEIIKHDPGQSGEIPEAYQVRIRVFRQINHSVHDFMNPRTALWLPDGYDLPQESLLVQTVESRLEGKDEKNSRRKEKK